MNIGINTRMLLKVPLEGLGRYTWETTKRMVIDHPENDYYFFFDRPFQQKFIIAENVHPVVLFPPARHPILWLWWYEFSLHRALKRLQIDCLYSPDGFAPLRTEVPVVLVSHDLAFEHYPGHLPWLTRNYYRIFAKLFHQKATHIIAVSEFTKQDILGQYQLDKSKLTVAYNGVTQGFTPLNEDIRQACRKEYSGGAPYFMYLGAIHPRKNVENIVKAFERFCDQCGKDWNLLIVGRFAWKSRSTKRLISASRTKNLIKVYQGLGEKVASILASSECLVYPSWFEGFGLPVLEAMSCGVPVITSKNSAMEEVASGAALLTDPSSVEEISRAMIHIKNDKDLRKSLGFKGLEMSKKYSWKQTGEIVYQKIEECMFDSRDGFK